MVRVGAFARALASNSFGGSVTRRRRFGQAMVGLGLATVLLSGCLPSHSTGSLGANRDCMRENPRFSDAWSCIKGQLATSRDAKHDSFIEEGDILAGQVRAGKVSERDARRRLSAGLSHEVGQ